MIIRYNRFVNLVYDLSDIKALDVLREQIVRFVPILTCIDYLAIHNNLVASNEKS
jgi:hypothetical protein